MDSYDIDMNYFEVLAIRIRKGQANCMLHALIFVPDDDLASRQEYMHA